MSMKHKINYKVILIVCILVNSFSIAVAKKIDLFYNNEQPVVAFAVDELGKVIQDKGISLSQYKLAEFTVNGNGMPVVFSLSSNKITLDRINKQGIDSSVALKPEGFSIFVEKDGIYILGADAAGLMYGGLELAEQIKVYGLNGVKPVTQNPYMAMRGTKFNIPLDVRTPSYTDVCDAAQQNIAEMWNFDFWKEYIDQLAKFRYNYISLWNLHPFPSMVKVPEYPNIALDDVKRSTVKWDEFYPLSGTGFDAPEILNNTEILKKLTIDEKIDFWRRVMQYGKERNVDFYVVTWNIFINGTDGKYGITDDFKNETTRDYFRKSVEQMFLTYPDLRGIGLTTGENMHGASFKDKEDWAYETYAKGVLDAVEKQPERKITFIHRQHQTGALDIADKFQPLIDHPDIEFIYSFKYAKAHVYSSVNQPYHKGFVNDIKDRGDLKTIWTLRNDDVFYFRWGAPGFVRNFVKNIPYDVSRGYYYGSDQYIWGREFLNKLPESPRQIEISKHWYQWMLWGRLAYNPDVTDERFESIVGARFPQIDQNLLFTAWQNASMIYPLTTGFHWGSLDFQWYIESCQSLPGAANTPSGFHDINRFISLPPHPGTDFISIPDYVDGLVNDKIQDGTSPVKVYQQLHSYADKALQKVMPIEPYGNKELAQTLIDIKTIAYLGKYYAHKIHAAIDWKIFLETGSKESKQIVQQELNMAAYFWRMYTSYAVMQNKNPLWTNRVGHVDWRKQYAYGVQYDLTLTGSERNIPNIDVEEKGVVFEAEDASINSGRTRNLINDFSGEGYVVQPDISFEFEVEKEAFYVLEFRYGMQAWVKKRDVAITVNGQHHNLECYSSGGNTNWVVDRLIVKLNKGVNFIEVKGDNIFWLDKMNIYQFY